MKRVMSITAKDSEGKVLVSYAPNFIGHTVAELTAKAEAIAKAHNGTVKITYWKK